MIQTQSLCASALALGLCAAAALAKRLGHPQAGAALTLWAWASLLCGIVLFGRG